MAVSKVQRIEGVPQFENTTECLEFIGVRNAEHELLKARAKLLKMQTANATKQLPALARGVTTDDLYPAKAATDPAKA